MKDQWTTSMQASEVSNSKKTNSKFQKKIKYDASIEDFRIANVLDNLDMNYLDASIRGIKFQKK